jgi:hypothetical protein
VKSFFTDFKSEVYDPINVLENVRDVACKGCFKLPTFLQRHMKEGVGVKTNSSDLLNPYIFA